MKKRNIQSAWLTGLLIVWSCLSTGCSEQSEPDVPQGELLQVSTLTRGTSDALQEGVRIMISPLLQTGEEAQGGYVTYAGKVGGKDTWNSGVYVDLDKQYLVYGFMPSDVVDRSSISAVMSGTSVTGATLRLMSVTALSDKDLCVVIGVGDGSSGNDVERGNFAYTPDYDSESGLVKGISLLMDHLYASASFKMKIDPFYNKLRTIKLKRLALKCTDPNKGGKADVIITFKNGYTDPIGSITTADVLDTGTAQLTLFEDADGKELEEDVSVIDVTRNFLPTFASTLSLVSTYDVYDKKGNKIRENCEATNSLGNVLGSISRGQVRPVVLTVNPTYLYVLSDPDLESPTVTVSQN